VDDVLGYAGRRVIVTGAASGIGAATTELLVELGAEVHALDVRKPSARGIASYTEADPRDPVELDAAVERIGRVLNALFNCAVPDPSSDADAVVVSFAGARHLTERVVPMMIEGAAVVTVTRASTGDTAIDASFVDELLATPDVNSARAWYEAHADDAGPGVPLAGGAVAAYTAARAAAFAEAGVRINCVHAGAGEPTWPLVLLNSPRAAPVTGAALLGVDTP
jgi:NAD(P)-dependent dehydrogenase (short-subunit alcohol dehydrogenase family)